MRDPAAAFYDDLAPDYDELIRQLVPRYDELVGVVVDLVVAADPADVLEIGPGTGALGLRLLEGLPSTRLTGVEASDEMAVRAGRAWGAHGDRARVVAGDVRAFEPDGRFDAAVASLVLHNLSPEERQGALECLASWLRPGGVFAWAEFVRFEDPEHQAAVERYRRRFSREAGCPEAVAERNYRKEAELDRPPTAEEILGSGRSAGFRTVDLVWAHDAFAVFRLRV